MALCLLISGTPGGQPERAPRTQTGTIRHEGYIGETKLEEALSSQPNRPGRCLTLGWIRQVQLPAAQSTIGASLEALQHGRGSFPQNLLVR
jgi:hypothetical protein